MPAGLVHVRPHPSTPPILQFSPAISGKMMGLLLPRKFRIETIKKVRDFELNGLSLRQ